ncbi:fimbria/pilus outer membrane usher protein [Brevundimonas sp. GCM10030266]|uniref:fimbria/pilus outer membrane usher protein n=1 Tax=Brevundimonas sp. GCM10030266 TaxID=3273386 RepID=UPI0036136486
MMEALPPTWVNEAPALSSEVIQTAPRRVEERLNPSGRDIPLGGPLKDGAFILGEISYTLTADDRILIDVDPLLDLLRPVLSPAAWQGLASAVAGRRQIEAGDLTALGFPVAYDPGTFGLQMDINPDARPRTAISISGSRQRQNAPVIAPANVSAYVTGFLTSDYVHVGDDVGFGTPSLLIDSAVRVRGFVLENEATIGEDFIREGTRLVYDDTARTARWTLGDLRPQSRGFSGSSAMAGLSLERVYADLEPQRNIQPRGQRSFTLVRPSTVEVFINGRSVQQTRLNPGSYDVSDFPFAQGSNDVRLVIRDDTGVESVFSFSIFFDRSLLAAGLTEFGVYAGGLTDFGPDGREYTSEATASGFFRRGFTDSFTAGANFQASGRGAVVGGETVWASRWGTIGLDLAVSSIEDVGEGYALNIGYERVFGIDDPNGSRSLSATFQTTSEDFATPGVELANNPFEYEAGFTYSQSIGSTQYVTADVFYSVGRDDNEDQASLRAGYGWRASSKVLLTAEAVYEDRRGESEVGLRVGLTYRLGQYSSVTGEIDTQRERARLGYQTSRGRGVNSWSAAANLDTSETATGVNGSFTSILNRAEVGGSHLTSFDSNGGEIVDQRTSLRAGASLVYADGRFGVSRPVYDSFALFDGHKTLKGAQIYVEPRDEYYTARSGMLGGAVTPELSAYSPRTITFDVPDAPTGYDIGSGAVEVMPPYRSGYLITVGSDYFVSASGQLLGADGNPASLKVGMAYEVSQPDRPGVRMFTNTSGRFAVQGLRAGTWRIVVGTDATETYLIEIPASADGLVRLGAVSPEAAR